MTTAKGRVLVDADTASIGFRSAAEPVAASAKSVASLSVPSQSRTITKTVAIRATDPRVNGGAPFLLAKAVITARFTLLQESRYEKIWSSSFDRYFNICIKGAKDVTAQGGLLYCEIRYPERVRMQTTAKIRNVPRPQLVSETDRGATTPDCPPGQVKTETTGRTDDTFECRDAAAARRADYTPYGRSVETVTRVWSGKKYIDTVSVREVPGAGPAWVKTVSAPLPEPTVQVTDIRFVGSVTWTFRATVTCSYRGSGCPTRMHIKKSDGTWANAFPDNYALLGIGGPYTKEITGQTYTCCGITPLPEARLADAWLD